MNIFATSDFHGYLPKVPDCDILLLAGDYTPNISGMTMEDKIRWYDTNFRYWLMELSSRNIKVVGIAGNHDRFFDNKVHESLSPFDWVYLEDSLVEINGLKIWGSPWSLTYGSFPFMGNEEFLKDKYKGIPDGVDILINHGPPYGILDKNDVDDNCGSKSLVEVIKRVKPKTVIFGHIHEGYGFDHIDGVNYHNVSYLNGFNIEHREVVPVYL